MSVLSKTFITALLVAATPELANALQYNTDKFAWKLTGFATSGVIEPDLNSTLFIGDWRVRGQMNYVPNNEYKFGIVYALDQAALDKGKWAREAFTYVESTEYGRIEVGFTDSIARKLGVGLPDVGGLRINDRPLYNEKIHADGGIIPDTTLTSGRGALRLNAVTSPGEYAQYGVSVAGITDDYDWAVDAGLKLRNSAGKVKTAYSLGMSFIDKPDNFDPEVYLPGVSADWRAQVSLGMNLQYNSWIVGVTTRAIYDQNPRGDVSDGIVAGIGASYDLMKYSVSLTYMFSDTGIWDSDINDFQDHTLIASFRYKYNEFVDVWMSGGTTVKTPFISAGLRLTF